MTVKEIIEKFLDEHGYDGLYNENGECACKRDDLMPCRHYCGDGQESCCVGYLQPITDTDTYFKIGEEKPEVKK